MTEDTGAVGISGELRIASPGKVNLFLELHGRRSDGYHELNTVMARCLPADQLVLQPSSQLEIFPENPEQEAARGIPWDSTNLILRAAEALRHHVVSRGAAIPIPGARIRVHKQIPAGSGLGGGSANAAAVLRGLVRLWDIRVDDEALHQIAAGLGSDINFLLSNTAAALCTGRGESVTPIKVGTSLPAVLFRPGSGNPTGKVFSASSCPAETTSAQKLLDALAAGDGDAVDAVCFNRLTEAARSVNEEMALLADRVSADTGKRVHLSGSGSTCFLFARSPAEAKILQSRASELGAAFAWATSIGI